MTTTTLATTDPEDEPHGTEPGVGASDEETLARAHDPDFEWEPAWKGEFLRNLRLMPSVSGAARVAGVARQHAYRARDRDPVFRLVWDDALEQATDTIYRFGHTLGTTGVEFTETRTTKRRELVDGVMKVVEETEVTTTGRQVSPQMTMFLLRAHRPDVFTPREKREHSGPGGGPVPVVVERHPDDVRLLELARIAVELNGGHPVIEGSASPPADPGV